MSTALGRLSFCEDTIGHNEGFILEGRDKDVGNKSQLLINEFPFASFIVERRSVLERMLSVVGQFQRMSHLPVTPYALHCPCLLPITTFLQSIYQLLDYLNRTLSTGFPYFFLARKPQAFCIYCFAVDEQTQNCVASSNSNYQTHLLETSQFRSVLKQIIIEMQRSDSLMSEVEEKERLELFVSCRNLDDLDYITVTDSFLVVKLQEYGQPEKTILKTKIYWNDLNPNYAETVLINFFFQIKQKLIFEVYHYDTPPKMVGTFETSVGQIFGSHQHGLMGDLMNKKKKAGKIVVRCEREQKAQKKMITLKLGAAGLPNMTWMYFFGGTNSFFRIFRKRHQDELLVYESEVVASTNPKWREFRISERRLVSNDKEKELELRVYNFSKTGKHEIIGSVFFKLKNVATGAKFDIIDQSKGRRGALTIDQYLNRVQHQFGDFMDSGLQLSLVTCIDFTASNGVPSDKASLHYIGGGMSQYQRALESVTSILLDYDYDKLVPVFGFGAKIKHPALNSGNMVHHCFPINANKENPNIFQLPGILDAYRKILPFLTLSGPTKFGELMHEAVRECRQYKKQGTHYMILFILTDGEIHDRQEAVDLLVECNTLPISVIIVGIGEGQFHIMKEFDDDHCDMVDSKGRHTQRDLVQFVEFSKFSNNGVALAKEVLEELPRQVAEYFTLVNVSPEDIKRNYKEDDIAKVVKQSGNYNVNPYGQILK